LTRYKLREIERSVLAIRDPEPIIKLRRFVSVFLHDCKEKKRQAQRAGLDRD
jgi:hypothetical protein